MRASSRHIEIFVQYAVLNVTAGLASATATGTDAVVTDAPNCGLGSVTATGATAATSISVNAGLASATATAYDATATQPVAVTVNADVATATASAYDADGADTTNVNLAATETQTAQILYSIVRRPTQTVGSLKHKAQKLEYKKQMSRVQHQRAELTLTLVPLDLPILEEDELILLLV